MSELLSYLIILGEEFGEFLMPPLRCFFLGDNAECWSSSTETKGNGMRERIIKKTRQKKSKHLWQQKDNTARSEVSEFKEIIRLRRQIGKRGWVNKMEKTGHFN